MEWWEQDVRWSHEQLTLAELRERHPELPVLVRVIHDRCTGNSNLYTNQVVVLHTWINQERVVAHNSRGHTISIPTNSTELFSFTNVTTESEHPPGQRITNILKSHQLPVEIEFLPDSKGIVVLGEKPYDLSTFGTIKLQSKHKLTYGLASILTHEEAKVKDLFPLPTSRPVDLQQACPLNPLQRAFLEDHTEKISELLGRFSENPSGEEFHCLPSVGIKGYHELLSGSCGTDSTMVTPQAAVQLTVTPADPATDSSKQDALKYAVNRFTHYQNLLSTSPRSLRKGIPNRSEPVEQEQTANTGRNPPRHQFGPATVSLSPKAAACSLKEGLLMVHRELGMDLKKTSKPSDAEAKCPDTDLKGPLTKP